MSEPDWSESKTGDCEIWKNPLIPMDERLLIADGAIRFRNEQIAKLKEQNALLTVQVQEGWKLVPVEPTADMIIAASDGYETGEVIGPASCYRVMIAAAPALPQQVKSDGVLDEPPQYYYSVDNPDYGYECYDDMDVIGFMPVGTEYEMTACWYQKRKYRVVKVADEVDDNHTVIDITEYAAAQD